MKFEHVPVLPKEVVNYLDPQPNENFIDCTLGGGGHAQMILEKTSPLGKLLGIDLDKAAIEATQTKLIQYKDRIIIIQDNYKNLEKIIYDNGFDKYSGILLDLGLSSYELQDPERGFSFQGNYFLDMRFGSAGKTAADIVNNYKIEDLVKIFKEYGEERYAKQIAQEIVKVRQSAKIETASQLVEIIGRIYKNKPKPKSINIATKVFQALRIEVNDELNNLRNILPLALKYLEKNGRLVVISFHSLEDRIVKDFFKRESKDCLCPPQLPVCNCGHNASLKILTKKPVTPTSEEITNNPKSRSAKLRAAVKII